MAFFRVGYMINREEKLNRGMKVKTIPEKNRKFKYSDILSLIIYKQSLEAKKIFEFKKSNLYKTHKKLSPLRHDIKVSGGQFTIVKYDPFLNKINNPIKKKDAMMYERDAAKQYGFKKPNKPIPYTLEDLEKKFGIKG